MTMHSKFSAPNGETIEIGATAQGTHIIYHYDEYGVMDWSKTVNDKECDRFSLELLNEGWTDSIEDDYDHYSDY